MGGLKPDTTAGFKPRVSLRSDIFLPSVDCVRTDGRLDASFLSPALQQVLLRMARVRNIVSSMLIEGERVELGRAVAVLDTERADTPNERAILQLSRVYDRIARGRSLPLTTASFCSIHREVFEGVLPDAAAGTLKERQNAIVEVGTGRVIFVPTPPKRVEAELIALTAWFEESKYLYPAPVAAGVFFAEFQAIHPFMDGNGRIGRLFNLSVMASLGLRNAPLVPLDTQFFLTRGRYYSAIATTNAGERYDLWLRYFVKQLLRAYRGALARTDLRATVDRFESRVARGILTWALSGSGDWFRHGQVPNPRGFSLPAITGALRRLTQAGILESKGERRGRRYRLRPSYLMELESPSGASQR
jgi:cell filamentation protein, protein adenylyltransferase